MHASMISPSMMCADIMKMKETLASFEESRISYLHIDITDGAFVPNFTLGTDYCRALHDACKIPLDIHLMIERPEGKLSWFDIREGDMVSVHAESTHHMQKALAQIRRCGAHPFVALNPATPLCVLDYVLDDIDGILLMTVNPGFAGQRLIPAALKKISDARLYLDAHGRADARIEVDGNVSFENAQKMRQHGADIFVAGTSSLFARDTELSEAIGRLYGAIL